MTASDATRSIQKLLDSLQKLSPQLESRKSDLLFLQNLISSSEFHSLIQVHREVSAATSSVSVPKCTNALTVCHSLAYDIETNNKHPETQELYDLLTSPHIDSLVSAHDRVANKEYPVVRSATVHQSVSNINSDSIEIVRIDKEKEPLGATVKSGKNGRVIISRVLHGGAADKSGLLHAGDEVHEIQGIPVRGLTVDQVADLMGTLRGTIVFKITPAISDLRPKRRTQPPIYMRTYFTYDPKSDHNHPCPEAGLNFERGSILQIVNQDDPNWWQAVHYNEDVNIQAGIIPSKTRKEKSLLCLEQANEQKNIKKKAKKKSIYSSVGLDGVGNTMFVTYEQVSKIVPQLERPRPIMLVAPRGGPFDMERLKTTIVETDLKRFGSPIKHTSRPLLPTEEEKGHTVCVSRQRMERDIQNNQYVEHGYFNGHYYGTSIHSIRSIINSRKTCIFVLIPKAIKLVRTGELKPFVIYCRAPTREHMMEKWVPSGLIRESHINDVLRQSVYLEQNYLDFFDESIIFYDVESASKAIIEMADRLTSDQQWIPTSWLDTTNTITPS